MSAAYVLRVFVHVNKGKSMLWGGLVGTGTIGPILLSSVL